MKGEALIYDLLNGYIRSKVLMAAHRLDVFTLLHRHPDSLDETLRRLRLPPRSGRALLDACVGLGLIESDKGVLRTPRHLAPHLVRNGTSEFRPPVFFIEHCEEHFEDLTRLVEIIKTDGEASRFTFWNYFDRDVGSIESSMAEGYSSFLEATVANLADAVLATKTIDAHRQLLDIAGGTGVFANAIAAKVPSLRAAFLDVPAVVALAKTQERSDCEAQDRVHAIGGDVFRIEEITLRQAPDLCTLVRVAADWEDDQLLSVLRGVHSVLDAPGTVMIVERMLPEEYDESAENLYLNQVYLLSKSRTSRYRRPSEYKKLLTRAGFMDVEVHVPSDSSGDGQFVRGLRIVTGKKM